MERILVWICTVLAPLLGLCSGSPTHDPRPVCWKAVLTCHGEPECHYAYDQYLYACASVLSGARRRCPSHCISSLVQLNRTGSGPALEDCDCALDPVCRSTQQAIEPCLPRTRTTGCTEARRQCELDPPCGAAMRDYLFHCRRLFGGQRCSDGCRRVIGTMRAMPRARQLDSCVCDGAERNICEFIKVSMKTFCSDSGDRFAGSGFSDSEEDPEDDDLDQEDYRDRESSSGPGLCGTGLLRVLPSVLVLTRMM